MESQTHTRTHTHTHAHTQAHTRAHTRKLAHTHTRTHTHTHTHTHALGIVGDRFLPVERSFVVVLLESKRGFHEQVLLSEPQLVLWLRAFRRGHPTTGQERVVGCNQSTFQKWLRRGLAVLGAGTSP